MSAKAFYHKTPPFLPALEDVPPEIWSTIIQYAAQSGSGLYDYEMTPSEHTDFLRGEDNSQMRVFFANFVCLKAIASTRCLTRLYLIQRTRSNLSRVNKAWYAMAAPFLFEYIHLANGRKIPFLCEAVLRSKDAAVSNGKMCSLGWWTKRLDLSMREPNKNVLDTVAQLASMLACFPNLRILTLSPTGHGYNDKIYTAFDSLSAPGSLKAIHLRTTLSCPLDRWTNILERHPALQSIWGPGYVNIKNKIVLKSLIALRPCLPPPTPTDSVQIVASHLPSLCCLSGYYNSLPFRDKFLQMVRTQLTILDLERVSYDRPLSAILTWADCPNLTQINIRTWGWAEFQDDDARSLSRSKSLKTLGLHIHQVQIPAKEMRRLLENVFPLFGSSSIRTIRFIHRHNVMALRRHNPQLLADGVQRLANLGVALKDHDDRPLLE